MDVGRWIAEKLQDHEDNDLSQNLIKFIEEKETSTLNSNRVSNFIHFLLNLHQYLGLNLLIATGFNVMVTGVARAPIF